jgi:hypothetical protein
VSRFPTLRPGLPVAVRSWQQVSDSGLRIQRFGQSPDHLDPNQGSRGKLGDTGGPSYAIVCTAPTHRRFPRKPTVPASWQTSCRTERSVARAWLDPRPAPERVGLAGRGDRHIESQASGRSNCDRERQAAITLPKPFQRRVLTLTASEASANAIRSFRFSRRSDFALAVGMNRNPILPFSSPLCLC